MPTLAPSCFPPLKQQQWFTYKTHHITGNMLFIVGRQTKPAPFNPDQNKASPVNLVSLTLSHLLDFNRHMNICCDVSSLSEYKSKACSNLLDAYTIMSPPTTSRSRNHNASNAYTRTQPIISQTSATRWNKAETFISMAKAALSTWRLHL